MNFLQILPLFVLTFCWSLQAQTQPNQQGVDALDAPAQRLMDTIVDMAVQNAMVAFKQGAYHQALDHLQKLNSNQRQTPAVLYWSGAAEHKLQRFDRAAIYLRMVLEKDFPNQYPDAAYLLGQSYYAMQDFTHAGWAFQKSIERKYKIAASNYYLGYCAKTNKQDKRALEKFQKVIDLDDEELQQSAMFEIGEVWNATAQETKLKDHQLEIYEKHAIPAYEKTIGFDHDSVIATQAEGRLAEILSKFSGLKKQTKTGTPLPIQPWVLRASEDIKYDSNVVNQPDDRVLKVTNTASFLSKTAGFGKYEFFLSNWLALTPELSIDLTYHSARGDPNIYSNDNWNFNPALRSRLEHFIGTNTRAAGLIEYEYAYSLRDYLAKYTQSYYSRSSNFIFGERVEYFKFGSTTFKANLKLSENSNLLLNFLGLGASLLQNWKISNHLLDTTVSFESQRAKDSLYDQKNYKFTLGYHTPEIFWKTTMDLSFVFLLIDTMNQKDTRGYEKNYSPSLTLTRFIKKDRWSVSLNYGFTRNDSKDTVNYAYSKHTVGVGTQYTF